jgi:hypothetical protein
MFIIASEGVNNMREDDIDVTARDLSIELSGRMERGAGLGMAIDCKYDGGLDTGSSCDAEW